MSREKITTSIPDKICVKEKCIECNNETNHIVLSLTKVEGYHEESGIDWTTSWQIIQCQGCESISFRKASSCSEDYYYDDYGDMHYFERIVLYPERCSRYAINDSDVIPNNVEHIYSETLKAMNSDQPVLSGIGIRALLEAICREKNAKGSSLLKKIDHLVEIGILTPHGAKILHKIRSLGNEAAHEITPHSPSQLSIALDVVENLIQSVYILPYHANKAFK